MRLSFQPEPSAAQTVRCLVTLERIFLCLRLKIVVNLSKIATYLKTASYLRIATHQRFYARVMGISCIRYINNMNLKTF